MATVDQKDDLQKDGEWRMSNKAMKLLQCFMSGLDDIIIRLALDIARKRVSPGETARVEYGDIKRAADHVLSQIRAQSDLPPALQSEINEMDSCLKAKCQEMM